MPPPVIVTFPVPKALFVAEFSVTRPALTKVPPVYVLFPVRITSLVPNPAFPRPSVPLMTSVTAPAPLFTMLALTMTSRLITSPFPFTYPKAWR